MIRHASLHAFPLACSITIAAAAVTPAAAADLAAAATHPAAAVAGSGDDQPDPKAGAQGQGATVQDQDAAVQDQAAQPADEQVVDQQSGATDAKGSSTDILSRNTVFLLLDGRFVVANGERAWVNGGLGKTRFEGTGDRDYQAYAVPVEADLIWTPRFTSSLSANVSAAWQRDQQNEVDLIEAFVNFLPAQKGPVGAQIRAGLMWPEISLEHSTGGAWSVVDTITPSAINSWVGEEAKVLGLEGTVRTNLGEHSIGLTGGVFGFNDTSGTLLSFRGWALHDEKATAFGHFPLPPLNSFITHAQEHRTRSLIEIDHRPGFYGRLDWRPPAPFGATLFYYDNRGDPKAFTPALQWGWRTRFLNLGINADLDQNTRLLAQVMVGSTYMGFTENGETWVHTRFRSAYVLVSHRLNDRWTVAGRIEGFRTHELGSEMSPLESEEGWSTTVAAKYLLNDRVTLKAEALNVRSKRPIRVNLGLDPFQAQTVFQLSVGVRL
jgi:hypothetical protein